MSTEIFDFKYFVVHLAICQEHVKNYDIGSDLRMPSPMLVRGEGRAGKGTEGKGRERKAREGNGRQGKGKVQG